MVEPGPHAMAHAVILFVLFTLLATGGVFWIAYDAKGWRVAVLSAVVTLLFFVGLAASVVWLVRQGLG